MAAIESGNDLLVSNIKEWLQKEFPDMIWEQDISTRGRYLVSRRQGFQDSDGHFYVGITKTFCWVTGNPGWATLSRAAPSSPNSPTFVAMVKDIYELRSRYANEAILLKSYNTQKSTKTKQTDSGSCVVQ